MKRILATLIAAFAAVAAQAQEEYGVVNISVCNLRATADFSAEMVSQALLGTPVHILQMSDNGNPWPEVQTPSINIIICWRPVFSTKFISTPSPITKTISIFC